MMPAAMKEQNFKERRLCGRDGICSRDRMDRIVRIAWSRVRKISVSVSDYCKFFGNGTVRILSILRIPRILSVCSQGWSTVLVTADES